VKMMNVPQTPEGQYLQILMTEREKLAPFQHVLPVCTRLLSDEIQKIRSFSQSPPQPLNMLQATLLQQQLHQQMHQMEQMEQQIEQPSYPHAESILPSYQEALPTLVPIKTEEEAQKPRRKRTVATKSEKIKIPIDQYPDFNFIGRLLGPRGSTLRKMEEETGCRIHIRGSGSLRNKEEEETLKTKQGYEHLNEDLHVVVEAHMAEEEATEAIELAKEAIGALLVPFKGEMDDIKINQLRELAIMNGTHQPRRDVSPGPRGSAVNYSSRSRMSNQGGLIPYPYPSSSSYSSLYAFPYTNPSAFAPGSNYMHHDFQGKLRW